MRTPNLLDAPINNNTSKVAKGLFPFKFLYITTHQTPRFETISQNVYKKSLYLVALGMIKFVGSFQNYRREQKEKPLSRRGNHALIAA